MYAKSNPHKYTPPPDTGVMQNSAGAWVGALVKVVGELTWEKQYHKTVIDVQVATQRENFSLAI